MQISVDFQGAQPSSNNTKFEVRVSGSGWSNSADSRGETVDVPIEGVPFKIEVTEKFAGQPSG